MKGKSKRFTRTFPKRIILGSEETELNLDLIRKYTTTGPRRGSIVVGVLFAFAVVVGGELYRTNSLAGLAASPTTALVNIALAIAVGLAAALVALLAFALQQRLAERPPRGVPHVLTLRRAAVVAGVVMFLCWLPCLLAYWPGLLTYDIPTQTDFVFEGSWTTQQPPLHTLIWAIFLKLEGAAGLHAITWYTLAQMAFLAAAFARMMHFLARRGTCLVIWIIAAVFCALNPVVALFAITPVKDTLLAGVLVLVLVSLAQLIADPRAFTRNPVSCVGLVVGLLVCCLLRENMLVAVAVFAIVAIVAFKGSRKAMALLCGTPLVVALVVIGPVYSMAGITAGSSAIASVPIQQVTHVVINHADELSKDELKVVNAVLPVSKLSDSHNPRFADTTVRLFKGRHSDLGGMRDSIIAFMQLWASFIPRYPLDMVDAFLALNVPYWYPFTHTPDPFSERDYIETSVWKTSDYYTVDADSKLPALRDAYEHVADYSALDNPLAGIVFSPSSAIWFIVMATFLLWNSGRRRNALLVMLPLLFWLSFLIGPVSNMRYMFPLFCLYPLLIASSLQPTHLLADAQTQTQEQKQPKRGAHAKAANA